MDFAFFRLPDGRAWVGQGPFQELESAPEAPCFYVNHFDLASASPWKVPSKLIEIHSIEDLDAFLPAAESTEVIWQRPVTEWFKMAFRRIRRDVLARKIQKMVPILTEQGARKAGNFANLIREIYQAPLGLWAYAWLQGNEGFLGATPELLFQLENEKLETMALAGTSKPNEAHAFELDCKEIEEHELVVDFIIETLSKLADVNREPREISAAAGLRHFRTLIHATLQGKASLNDLIQSLHPTPAVGALPRTPDTLERLAEYRRQMETPDYFGAPFGFQNEGKFQAVVAIRGISWKGDKVYLPSGCGIVAGSAFDHEWRELRLKRESVAHLLKI